MTSNVLLTGGFGTLGGRLAALLSGDANINLRLASREKRPAPSWAPRAETVQVDFDNAGSIKNMLQDVSHVVHLVAMPDFESRAEPELAKVVNTQYTQRVLDACAPNVRFVYLSTIQVYGGSLKGVVTEKTPTRPTEVYAQTHLDAEKLVETANQQGRIRGVTLRNANGFGAPMSKDAKIWQIITNDLCRQAVETKELLLKSHGQQFRNFIPFSDVVSAINHSLRADFAWTDSTTFNLGGAKSIRVLEMASMVADRCETTLGFRPQVQTLGEQPSTQPESFVYDSSKFKATGFSPEYRVGDEIDHLLKACQRWFGR